MLEAKDPMRLEPDRVYVMPSNVDISLADGHFGLRPRSTARTGKSGTAFSLFLPLAASQ